MVVVVYKIIFINLCSCITFDFSIDFMHRRLVSVWLQPLWLKDKRQLHYFIVKVNYSLHFHEGEYQDEGQLLSLLSLPITTVLFQPASSSPVFLFLSFFFLCYCRNANTSTWTPWRVPARTGDFHCCRERK